MVLAWAIATGVALVAFLSLMVLWVTKPWVRHVSPPYPPYPPYPLYEPRHVHVLDPGDEGEWPGVA